MKKFTILAVLLTFFASPWFPVADAARDGLERKFKKPVARLNHSGDIKGTVACQETPVPEAGGELVPGEELAFGEELPPWEEPTPGEELPPVEEPVPPSRAFGILVFLPGTSFVAKTDENGEFTIFNVPAGTYSLAAEVTGLEPAIVQTEVLVEAKKPTELELIEIPCSPVDPEPEPIPDPAPEPDIEPIPEPLPEPVLDPTPEPNPEPVQQPVF